MIREILTSQPQQTLQHINPSHQDEPFQSTKIVSSKCHNLDGDVYCTMQT